MPTKPERRALIVEDQEGVARALSVLFDVHGIPCLVAKSASEALRAVSSERIGAVLQDMNFSPGETSGEEGIALFRNLRRLDPGLPILLMTAWTSLSTAVQLVKEGASDYVAKPWDDALLIATVRELLALREAEEPAPEGFPGAELCGLVFASDSMRRLVALALRVAAADVPVLITGPNGVGKEKIADILQANSPRKAKPFVKVNVGALPDELLESELFGAESGAFTGATKRRIGRFEAADSGTIFLDEIGNLSPKGQMKLLRVLQNREFQRLGSSETRHVDVRVLSATNSDLRKAIAEGRFREDLYFRLNVIELAIPKLAERPDDILKLAASFLRSLPPRAEGPVHLSSESERALLSWPWPGNVRELFNRLQRASLVGLGPALTPEDLGLVGGMPSPTDGSTLVAPDAAPSERTALDELLRRHHGSVSKVAEELGISRQALYRRMEKHGIVLERRPRD